MKKWKDKSKRTGETIWRARFELNNKTFRPKAETKEKLDKLIRAIENQEEIVKANQKYNIDLETVSFIPTLETVLNKALPTIEKPNHKIFSERVFEAFLRLLPIGLKVDELKKTHFQTYYDFRAAQLGEQSKKPIQPQTIFKELYAVRSALKKAPLYFDSLEEWRMPDLPPKPKGLKKKTRRERLVSGNELQSVIAELIKQPEGKQTFAHHFSRVRLAHQLEFQNETGLRRKEIATLKFSQYDASEKVLRNVKRWKTDSITKYFPVSARAAAIIEERRPLQKDSEYIFTPNGKPIESTYRTLKNVCEDLEIPYGRFTDGGFVAHDLRHNFGTEIIQGTDIETARELLGHSNIKQTSTYVHTNADRLRDAVRKRDKIDYRSELLKIFEAVKKGELHEKEFLEKLQILFGF